MLIEVLMLGISSSFTIHFVTNIPWLYKSSRANIFTCFCELQCLTGTTHMPNHWKNTYAYNVASNIINIFNSIKIAFHGSKLFINFLYVVIQPWRMLPLKNLTNISVIACSCCMSWSYLSIEFIADLSTFKKLLLPSIVELINVELAVIQVLATTTELAL